MSLNKKWKIFLGSTAVILLSIAILIYLNLKINPDLSGGITGSTVEMGLDLDINANPAAQNDQLAEQSVNIVGMMREYFILVLLLFAGNMGILIIFAGRESCIEGIEWNPAVLLGAVSVLIALHDRYEGYAERVQSGLSGSALVYGRPGWGDMILVVLTATALVWVLWTFFSWCLSGFSVKWSFLYRITELLASKKNGFSWMILVPSVCMSVGLIGFIYSVYMTKMGHSRWMIRELALLSELIVFFLVLIDRMRTILDKQQQIIEEIKVSERMRVDLVTNVSHDLRTPLTAIIGYGELLEKEALSEEGRQNLSRLHQKSRYLQEMVDAVFELSKVSSGIMKCRQDQLDLHCLLEQTIGDFEEELAAKRFEIRRHYEAEPVMIVSDGIFLHQIFSNLLSNAIKYTMPGTRIHVQLKTEGEWIVVRMINVSAYEMKFTEQEILERFARGDASRNTEGSGLGLAIAKTYTEALSGTFHVEIDSDQFVAVVKLPGVENSLKES